MKKIAIAIIFLTICGAARAGDLSLKGCSPTWEDFRIEPYLAVAKGLQQLGQDKAVVRLRKWAKSRKNTEIPVIVLTRMLFEKKGGGEIRRPGIGGAAFLGGTNYEDWPVEPITLHQGIPILITQGYTLMGLAEPSEAYLDECLKNGIWRTVKYTEADHTRLEKIIEDFIRTTKWKQPLQADEESFLTKQAKETIPGNEKKGKQDGR
jgi:hypothetical protein